jgi:hypothetical protein
MTGYALAFPVHSKYKAMFNEKLLELRENGEPKTTVFKGKNLSLVNLQFGRSLGHL